MPRKYFNSTEQQKRKKDTRKRDYTAEKIAREAWLKSDEYKQAIADIKARELIATKYALDYMMKHGELIKERYQEFLTWINDRSELINHIK